MKGTVKLSSIFLIWLLCQHYVVAVSTKIADTRQVYHHHHNHRLRRHREDSLSVVSKELSIIDESLSERAFISSEISAHSQTSVQVSDPIAALVIVSVTLTIITFIVNAVATKLEKDIREKLEEFSKFVADLSNRPQTGMDASLETFLKFVYTKTDSGANTRIYNVYANGYVPKIELSRQKNRIFNDEETNRWLKYWTDLKTVIQKFAKKGVKATRETYRSYAELRKDKDGKQVTDAMENGKFDDFNEWMKEHKDNLKPEVLKNLEEVAGWCAEGFGWLISLVISESMKEMIGGFFRIAEKLITLGRSAMRVYKLAKQRSALTNMIKHAKEHMEDALILAVQSATGEMFTRYIRLWYIFETARSSASHGVIKFRDETFDGQDLEIVEEVNKQLQVVVQQWVQLNTFTPTGHALNTRDTYFDDKKVHLNRDIVDVYIANVNDHTTKNHLNPWSATNPIRDPNNSLKHWRKAQDMDATNYCTWKDRNHPHPTVRHATGRASKRLLVYRVRSDTWHLKDRLKLPISEIVPMEHFTPLSNAYDEEIENYVKPSPKRGQDNPCTYRCRVMRPTWTAGELDLIDRKYVPVPSGSVDQIKTNHHYFDETEGLVPRGQNTQDANLFGVDSKKLQEEFAKTNMISDVEDPERVPTTYILNDFDDALRQRTVLFGPYLSNQFPAAYKYPFADVPLWWNGLWYRRSRKQGLTSINWITSLTDAGQLAQPQNCEKFSAGRDSRCSRVVNSYDPGCEPSFVYPIPVAPSGELQDFLFTTNSLARGIKVPEVHAFVAKHIDTTNGDIRPPDVKITEARLRLTTDATWASFLIKNIKDQIEQKIGENIKCQRLRAWKPARLLPLHKQDQHQHHGGPLMKNLMGLHQRSNQEVPGEVDGSATILGKAKEYVKDQTDKAMAWFYFLTERREVPGEQVKTIWDLREYQQHINKLADKVKYEWDFYDLKYLTMSILDPDIPMFTENVFYVSCETHPENGSGFKKDTDTPPLPKYYIPDEGLEPLAQPLPPRRQTRASNGGIHAVEALANDRRRSRQPSRSGSTSSMSSVASDARPQIAKQSPPRR